LQCVEIPAVDWWGGLALKTLILAAAFSLALATHAHSQYQYRLDIPAKDLETDINREIEVAQDLKRELTMAGINVVVVLAMPEAEGGIAVGTAERLGKFCKDYLETKHKLETPNLWAKYQQLVTINKNISDGIALLRHNAGNPEAERFLSTPAVREWSGLQAEIKRRAHSCAPASRRARPPHVRNTARCRGFLLESQQINGAVGRRQTYCMYQLCMTNGGQIPSLDYNQCR
jgi:hypothetical protein